MEDLKETHKGQHQRPENSATKELKCDMEEVADFRGSRAEKLIMLFCRQAKLNYSRLMEKD